jgi:hypothetical protein
MILIQTAEHFSAKQLSDNEMNYYQAYRIYTSHSKKDKN